MLSDIREFWTSDQTLTTLSGHDPFHLIHEDIAKITQENIQLKYINLHVI